MLKCLGGSEKKVWEVKIKICGKLIKWPKYLETSQMTKNTLKPLKWQKKKKTLKPLERQKKYFQNLKNEQKHLETSKMIRNSSKLVKWPKYPPKSL